MGSFGGLPFDGYENVAIIVDEVPPKAPSSAVGSVEPIELHDRVLQLSMPVEIAEDWFVVAKETVEAVADPEARYVTGHSTAELSRAVQKLQPDR